MTDIERDHWDYAAVLAEFGITEEEMQRAAEMVVHSTRPNLAVEINVSPLAGRGVFMLRRCATGSLIGWLKHDYYWTQLGRFANHSAQPSANVRASMNGLVLHASRLLQKGDEVTVNYREVRRALESNLQLEETHHG